MKILGLSWISKGGISGTVVDAKLILQTALKANASGIIHNQPSDQLIASDADHRIAEKVKNGGKLLNIGFHDHLILTSESYLSMADKGEI